MRISSVLQEFNTKILVVLDEKSKHKVIQILVWVIGLQQILWKSTRAMDKPINQPARWLKMYSIIYLVVNRNTAGIKNMMFWKCLTLFWFYFLSVRGKTVHMAGHRKKQQRQQWLLGISVTNSHTTWIPLGYDRGGCSIIQQTCHT